MSPVVILLDPWILTALALGAVALLTLVLLRRRGRTLLGPLFFYDVIRLARRGRSTLLRCVYALALFGGLSLVYTAKFPHADLFQLSLTSTHRIPPSQLSNFARTFVLGVLLVQAAAVPILTPAYVASAIVEEKERKTLELLFTTALRDHEIVLGKMFARLAHLVGILLAGLPVLALLTLWGGLDGPLLIGAFVTTLCSLISAGSVCILLSVLCRTTLGAVILSYVLLAGVGVCCLPFPFRHISSPVAFLYEAEEELARVESAVNFRMTGGPPRGGGPPPTTPSPWETVAPLLVSYVFVHGLVAAPLVLIAALLLRSQTLGELPRAAPPPPPQRRRPPPTDRPRPPPRATERTPHAAPPRLLPLPPVWDRALLWKETHCGGDRLLLVSSILMPLVAVFLGALLVVACLTALVTLLSSGEPERVQDHLAFLINRPLRLLSILALGFWAVGAGLRAAASVCRERERGTLDTLLLLPTSRREVLAAKWLGSLMPFRALGYCLLPAWGLGICSGALQPFGVLFLVLSAGVHLALTTSLGLWVSLASRKSLSALSSMALMLLVQFGAVWLWALYVDLDWSQQDLFGWSLGASLNPIHAWWHGGTSWEELLEATRGGRGNLVGAMVAGQVGGLAIVAAAAWFFWRLALQRFQREQVEGRMYG